MLQQPKRLAQPRQIQHLQALEQVLEQVLVPALKPLEAARVLPSPLATMAPLVMPWPGPLQLTPVLVVVELMMMMRLRLRMVALSRKWQCVTSVARRRQAAAQRATRPSSSATLVGTITKPRKTRLVRMMVPHLGLHHSQLHLCHLG